MEKIKLDPKIVALTFGTFGVIVKAAWSVIVASGKGGAFLKWLLGLHFVESSAKIAPFSPGTAVLMLLLTFIVAAVFGFVFANVWNFVSEKF